MTHNGALESIWLELVSQAVLGTDRDAHPMDIKTGDEHARLAGLLAALEQQSADAPSRLLALAGTLAVYREAGQLPEIKELPTLVPAPMDDLPPCPPRAARRLARLLAGDGERAEARLETLAEWLRLAAQSGVRIPPERLPEALELGRRKPRLAEAVCTVIGARGRWLAAHNPEWAYAAPSGDPQATWETGTTEQRSRLLAQVRREWPEEGLRLVQSTWEQDSAAERHEFLSRLEIGLSMADEPFLEATLDDRSGPVRQAAAELLKRLPASRLVQRMTRRAEACLSYEAGRRPLSRSRLGVQLPERCDAGMRRDGVDPKPRAGTGEKASWLAQIVAAVPPAHWSQKWKVSPEELLLRLGESEWEALLIEALCKAARRFPDPAWIAALVAVDGERPELIEALPEAEAEACLIQALRRRPNGSGLWMAARYSRPWSPALTQAVIEHLHRNAARLDSTPTDWSGLKRIEAMGYRMDPARRAEAGRWLAAEAQPGSPLAKTFESLIEILEFREEMRKEFGL